jgi:hypothetical protein
VHRFLSESVPANQATRIRLIVGVVFDYIAPKNADQYLIKGQVVRLSCFVGVIGDAYSVLAYRANDVFNVH